LVGDETFHQMCIAGKRCCPPEDCGGPQAFAELLKALQEASHPSHVEACEWLGDFDPESFWQTKLTDGCAGVGNIEPDISPALISEDGPAPFSALASSAPPAFKHTIDVVANCVSSLHPGKSPH